MSSPRTWWVGYSASMPTNYGRNAHGRWLQIVLSVDSHFDTAAVVVRTSLVRLSICGRLLDIIVLLANLCAIHEKIRED